MNLTKCNSFRIQLLLNHAMENHLLTQSINKRVDGHLSRRAISMSCVRLKKDFYETLGLNRNATNRDIKSAYYNLSKAHHPDKNKGCEQSAKLFHEISEAYEVLGNYHKKRLYDRGAGFGRKQSKVDVKEEVEIIFEPEEDDAQTKFYKQHMKRTERPAVTGRSTIYNFDEWTSQCISDSFQRTQQVRKNIANEARDRLEAENEAKSVIPYFVPLFVFVSFIGISLSLYLVNQEERREIDEKLKRKKVI